MKPQMEESFSTDPWGGKGRGSVRLPNKTTKTGPILMALHTNPTRLCTLVSPEGVRDDKRHGRESAKAITYCFGKGRDETRARKRKKLSGPM